MYIKYANGVRHDAYVEFTTKCLVREKETKYEVDRLAKNPSGNRCRTFRPGFLWTARFYLNPKRVWHGIPGKSFPTIPNIPDFLASLFKHKIDTFHL